MKLKYIKYHDRTNCIIPLVCIGTLSTSCFIYLSMFNFNNKTKTRRILENSSNFLYCFGLGLTSYYLYNNLKYRYSLKYYLNNL